MSRPLSGQSSTPYHIALLAALLLAGVFIVGQWQRSLLNFVSVLLSPSIAIVTVVSAVMTVTKIGMSRSNRLSIVWLSFMLGVVLWFLSQVGWVIYPLILGISAPIPSVADVFGLGGYAPILFGCGYQAWPFREAFHTKKMLLTLIAISSGGLLAWSALTQVVVQSGIGLAALMVSYAYVILDIVTMMIAVPILLVFLKGTFWKPFLFLVLGIVLALSAHLLSTWATSNQSYYSGHPLELLIDWGYLSAALGFYLMRKKIGERSL